MPGILIDTHALYWYLLGDPQLSANARAAIQQAETGATRAYIPVIVLAELFYVNKKYQLRLDFSRVVALLHSAPGFEIVSFGIEDVLSLAAPQFQSIPEMHDRLIAITASRLGAILITKNRQIQGAGAITTLW